MVKRIVLLLLLLSTALTPAATVQPIGGQNAYGKLFNKLDANTQDIENIDDIEVEGDITLPTEGSNIFMPEESGQIFLSRGSVDNAGLAFSGAANYGLYMRLIDSAMVFVRASTPVLSLGSVTDFLTEAQFQYGLTSYGDIDASNQYITAFGLNVDVINAYQDIHVDDDLFVTDDIYADGVYSTDLSADSALIQDLTVPTSLDATFAAIYDLTVSQGAYFGNGMTLADNVGFSGEDLYLQVGELTDDQTITFPDGTGTLPLPNLPQTWSATQTFSNLLATNSVALGPYYSFAQGRFSISGNTGELSFMSRGASSWVDTPSNGERWVAYATGNEFIIWSGIDRFKFQPDGDFLPTGSVQGVDGTTAKASFGFASDPDTGIYRLGDNALGLLAGGTTRAFINADGVNTNSDFVLPEDGRVFWGASDFAITDDSGVGLGFDVGGSNYYAFRIGGNDAMYFSNGYFALGLNGSAVFEVDSGTSYFATNVEFNGNTLYMDGTNTYFEPDGSNYTFTTNGNFLFRAGGQDALFLDTSGVEIPGNLIVGTYSYFNDTAEFYEGLISDQVIVEDNGTSAPLVVNQQGSGPIAQFFGGQTYPGMAVVKTNNGAELQFYHGTGGTAYGKIGFRDGLAGIQVNDYPFHAQAGLWVNGGELRLSGNREAWFSGLIRSYGNQHLRLNPETGYDFIVNGSSASDALVVKSGGAIGVGTNSPATHFHVRGSGSRLRLDNTTGDPVLEFTSPTGTSYLFTNDSNWHIRTDNTSKHVKLQSGQAGFNQGNVQIGNGSWNSTGYGPTPASQLSVRGNTNSSTAGLLDVQAYAGTSRLFVRDDGNVGVGTTSPGAKLDVNGTMRATGETYNYYVMTAEGTLSIDSITQRNVTVRSNDEPLADGFVINLPTGPGSGEHVRIRVDDSWGWGANIYSVYGSWTIYDGGVLEFEYNYQMDDWDVVDGTDPAYAVDWNNYSTSNFIPTGALPTTTMYTNVNQQVTADKRFTSTAQLGFGAVVANDRIILYDGNNNGVGDAGDYVIGIQAGTFRFGAGDTADYQFNWDSAPNSVWFERDDGYTNLNLADRPGGFGRGYLKFWTYDGQTVPTAQWRAVDVGSYQGEQVFSVTPSSGSANPALVDVLRLRSDAVSPLVAMNLTQPINAVSGADLILNSYNAGSGTTYLETNHLNVEGTADFYGEITVEDSITVLGGASTGTLFSISRDGESTDPFQIITSGDGVLLQFTETGGSDSTATFGYVSGNYFEFTADVRLANNQKMIFGGSGEYMVGPSGSLDFYGGGVRRMRIPNAGTALLLTPPVSSSAIGLSITAGNTGVSYGQRQLLMGYNGNMTYAQGISTRHASGADADNAIDFFLWDHGVDAANSPGTFRALTLDQTGSTLFTPLRLNNANQQIREFDYGVQVVSGGNVAVNFRYDGEVRMDLVAGLTNHGDSWIDFANSEMQLAGVTINGLNGAFDLANGFSVNEYGEPSFGYSYITAINPSGTLYVEGDIYTYTQMSVTDAAYSGGYRFNDGSGTGSVYSGVGYSYESGTATYFDGGSDAFYWRNGSSDTRMVLFTNGTLELGPDGAGGATFPVATQGVQDNTVTADDTDISVGTLAGRVIVFIESNNATATNRTVNLLNGTGGTMRQEVTLVNKGPTGAFEVSTTGRASGETVFTADATGESITFWWDVDNTVWREISRSTH